jgi:hypothetical protein
MTQSSSPSEAVVVVTLVHGLSFSVSVVSQDMSVKGVHTAREESLSSRDRGVDRSGIVLTSGMRRRVLWKCIKLANPKCLW